MTDRHRDVRARLRAIPADLATAARAASPEPPSPGEWTPSDIVRHLIAVETEVWQPRLATLATEEHPQWPWVDVERWEDEPGATLDQLLATYTAAREATLATLGALDDEGWDRTGTHATFGTLDVAGLMERAVDHDEEHVRSFRPET